MNKNTYDVDVSQKVMEKIKRDNLKIKSPWVFLVERLGLEGTWILFTVLGAVVLTTVFFMLKKTGIVDFLSLGILGLKVFLLSLPYQYLALFLLAVIMTSFMAHWLNKYCYQNVCLKSSALAMITLSGFLGLILVVTGAEEFLERRISPNIPEDFAIYGKIKNVTDDHIILEKNEGSLVRVELTEETYNKEKNNLKIGNYIRAVGESETNQEEGIFRVKGMKCYAGD